MGVPRGVRGAVGAGGKGGRSGGVREAERVGGMREAGAKGCRGKLKYTAGAPFKSTMTVQFLHRHS